MPDRSQFKLANFYDCRLGDTIAHAYLLDYYKHILNDDEFIYIIINNPLIPAQKYFPWLQEFKDPRLNKEIQDKIFHFYGWDRVPKEFLKLPMVQFGNLWLSAPECHLKSGYLPRIHIPKDNYLHVTRDIKKPLLVIHELNDAYYNVRRNMEPQSFKKLCAGLVEQGFEVFPIPTNRQHSIPDILSIIDQADLYIGGDTGFTHAAAAMRKYILAIYGPDADAKKEFAAEQMKMNCESSWSSDPISDTYLKFIMENSIIPVKEILDATDGFMSGFKMGERFLKKETDC